jgi:hypothetical protein
MSLAKSFVHTVIRYSPSAPSPFSISVESVLPAPVLRPVPRPGRCAVSARVIRELRSGSTVSSTATRTVYSTQKLLLTIEATWLADTALSLTLEPDPQKPYTPESRVPTGLRRAPTAEPSHIKRHHPTRNHRRATTTHIATTRHTNHNTLDITSLNTTHAQTNFWIHFSLDAANKLRIHVSLLCVDDAVRNARPLAFLPSPRILSMVGGCGRQRNSRLATSVQVARRLDEANPIRQRRGQRVGQARAVGERHRGGHGLVGQTRPLVHAAPRAIVQDDRRDREVARDEGDTAAWCERER